METKETKNNDINITTNFVIFNGKEKRDALGFSRSGEIFFVDADDVDLLKDYTWYYNKTKNDISTVLSGDHKPTYLHRFIMGQNEDIEGKQIDHINHNRKDNRKSNLRVCSQQENLFCRAQSADTKSGIIGVYGTGKSWTARIGLNHKLINLGSYATMEDAIKARLEAELLYYRDYAPQKALMKKYGIGIESDIEQ